MDTKPWLKHYDDGVPHTLQPYPERTLLDIVSDTARQRPDHLALLFQGARLSYGQLEQLSDAFAAALVAQGVRKGDRVALLLDDYQIEAVKAWVVLREGQQITVDELRAYCRETLAAYKVPKHIEFRDNLPKTMVGKVLRRELVQEQNFR